MEPLPHLLLDVPERDGSVTREVWMYRVIRRNGIAVHVECDAALWPKIRDDCLKATQSLTSTVEEWPPAPVNCRMLLRDGYEYWVHPSVKDGDLDALHKILRDEEAAFAKVHGAVPKPPESPFVVVVHARREDEAAVDANAADAHDGIFASQATGRLFVVPPGKGDAVAASELAREAWRALLRQTFGGDTPSWLDVGEGIAAGAEELTGRPLPSVPQGLVPLIPKTLQRFDEIVALERADADDRYSMFAYVAFFRCGGKSWRDAFAAFLKDSAATGDCTGAQKRHLLSLDQGKLRTAAQAFVAKGLTPVKGR
jgi:hypothetical protein